MSDILKQAHDIIFLRSEEKVRQYGPFAECNRKVAEITSILTGKEITTEDVYKFQIALKLARESYAHKEDNLLDLVAYAAALNNFHEGIEPGVSEDPQASIEPKLPLHYGSKGSVFQDDDPTLNF
ncbi:MAG: hypothetical protein IKX02_03340 [Spirochaetales bacterium]|nr:hypothetical protein [Spirochaetales bacterium]